MAAMSPPQAFCNILITGASAGIGAALAEAYAAPGVRLALVGRDAARLEEVAGRCRQLGAEAIPARMDVTDRAALAAWIAEWDRAHPLDLVIANAGVASTIAGEKTGESWEAIQRIFDTNLYGMLATVYPAMEAMRGRGRGQIAMMSSLGAYVGMPISPAYNGSKAAIKVYGEGLRGWLAPQGVGVTVICPGFVQSAMSDDYPGPRPFLVTAERAAAIIKRGLARNRARIAFPFPLALAMGFLALLPPGLSLALQRLFRFG
jgi:short-subunit dehydrogenase